DPVEALSRLAVGDAVEVAAAVPGGGAEDGLGGVEVDAAYQVGAFDSGGAVRHRSPNGFPGSGRNPSCPEDRPKGRRGEGRSSVTGAPGGGSARVGGPLPGAEVVRNQRVGVSVTEPVLGLQPVDQLLVAGQAGGAQRFQPFGDGAPVLLFDRGEVAGRAFRFLGHGLLLGGGDHPWWIVWGVGCKGSQGEAWDERYYL